MDSIYITAEGAEAFDNLHSMIETLMENGAGEHWAQKMGQALKEAKRYFKTDFKVHAGRNENSKDHCTVYALSDPTNLDFSGECQHSHDTGCDRCESLDMVLEEVAEKLEEVDITEDQKARMKFENKQCTDGIHAWKAHLIRSVTQEEAKQSALNQLDEGTCLIIIDWAMKYLPSVTANGCLRQKLACKCNHNTLTNLRLHNVLSLTELIIQLRSLSLLH